MDQPVADFAAVRAEIARVIVGQDALVTRLLIALLCDGHCLIEGVPGLAKSLTVETLARAFGAAHARIQFTPDLLPADLTGGEIYNAAEARFEVRRGPIFTHVLLADEINRAPAKVQSALLEAMQERQVSIGGRAFSVPDPFLVLATQNPIEQEGTYPLPEAQLDRFLLKVISDYPGEQEERRILDLGLDADPDADPAGGSGPARAQPVASLDSLLAARRAAAAVRMEPPLRDYVVRVARASRAPERSDPELAGYVEFGASPRATQALARAARASAFLDGRAYAGPEDVKSLAPDVLRHRLALSYEAEAEGVTAEQVVARLLDRVPLP